MVPIEEQAGGHFKRISINETLLLKVYPFIRRIHQW